jgi:DNA-nicking Smr family endonuclease
MGQKPTKPSSPFDVLKGVKLTPKPSAADTNKSANKNANKSASRAAATNTPPEPAAALPGVDYAERVAIRHAYAGVRRLDQSDDSAKVVRPEPKSPAQVARQGQRDAEARARLDAFVGQAMRFVVQRDGDHVQARRDDVSASQAARLFTRVAAPEKKLDLHGLRADDAARQVVTFVRAAQREGKRVVLIVHGRGQRSAGGVGVLPDVVLETLSRGGAAPVVRAFMSAPQRQGGAGAVVVFLVDR